ncbi:uncharacterized protein SCODWIG_00768 [Saccharomycodes ludwigii]|uniref:Uncharacterized protein n=1 Tax=Saccharomycodes ludwigii TaxID=36035 RepID=A0A376B2V4_9ASCO|nr:hypothetical protein SCDLUD_004880 [Saccharomycodes ludwigii]KAH3899437.1 hypothetical protein SCDLUD_004880 [Saccharomycodes ludwigii]SSD59007.1 uncharacterized protein SCODWIG_00768 [Saccharomycodes ludwigii]
MNYRDSYFNYIHLKESKEILYLDWQRDVFPAPDQLYGNPNNAEQHQFKTRRDRLGRYLENTSRSSASNDNRNNPDGINNNGNNANATSMAAGSNYTKNYLGSINQFWDYYHDEDDFKMFQLITVNNNGSIVMKTKNIVPTSSKISFLKNRISKTTNSTASNTNGLFGALNYGIGNNSTMMTPMEFRMMMNEYTSNTGDPNFVTGNMNSGSINHGIPMMNQHDANDGDTCMYGGGSNGINTLFDEDDSSSNNLHVFGFPRRKLIDSTQWPEYGLERFMLKTCHMKTPAIIAENNTNSSDNDNNGGDKSDDNIDIINCDLVNNYTCIDSNRELLALHATEIFDADNDPVEVIFNDETIP